jgi:hypothetical protein
MIENRSITGLVEYISSLTPDFLKDMYGAEEIEIYQLERITEAVTDCSFPFSEEYLEFLRTMGGKTPIPFAYDAKMEAFAVMKIYEILRHDGEQPPADCILIASGGYDVERVALEYFVDVSGNLTTGRVFSTSGNRLKYVMADSFLNLLFRRAFEMCASVHLPVTGTFIGTTKEPSLAKIAELSVQFSLQKQWFSDSVTLSMCSAQNDLILYSEQAHSNYNWLKLVGRDKKQLAAIGQSICEVASMEFESWW